MDTFYPFVDNNQSNNSQETNAKANNMVPQPMYPARIAVYDDLTVPPRVVVIEPKDIRTYLQEIQDTVYNLMMQQGGSFGYSTVRELVENYIHASFIEPTISILDQGMTLVFSDQGPGIPNKESAIKPSFTSATVAMKQYIRGVGSGFPTVEQNIHARGGSIKIEDNIGHGTVVTISLPHKDKTTEADENPSLTQDDSSTSTPNQAAFSPSYQQPGLAPQFVPQSQYGYPQTNPYAGQQGYPTYQPYGAPAQPGAVQQPYPGTTPYPSYQGQYPSQAYPPPYPMQAYPPAWQQPYPAGSIPVPTASGGQVPGAVAPGSPAHDNTGFSSAPSVTLTHEQELIVRLFATKERLGTTEVNESLGLSKSTGTRRLQELTRIGLVYKPDGKKYALTDEGRRTLERL